MYVLPSFLRGGGGGADLLTDCSLVSNKDPHEPLAIYTTTNEVVGCTGFTMAVCLSIRMSICPSVSLLKNGFRMITSFPFDIQ